MKVLVTGAAGFIGSHVSEHLQSHGSKVLGVDNFSTGKTENTQAFLSYGGAIECANILDPALDHLFKVFSPDVVIHLAAQPAISTSVQKPVYDAEENVLGTLTMLLLARRFGTRKFVLASTSAVYEEDGWLFSITENCKIAPASPYGISKASAEMYARVMCPDSVILRFGNVYGARQTPLGENQVIPRMIRHFEYGDEFYIHGDGKQKRDFVFVQDVVSAISAAMDGAPGTYNISTNQAHSVNQVAAIIEEIYGVKGYPWEHTEQNDPRRKVQMSNLAAFRYLNWMPLFTLREGIEETVKWWKEQKKASS